MKLIGSKQEQDFRKELEGSNLVLAKDGKAEKILNVLRVTFGELKSAYILNWTPEQGEDIYTILVDIDKIAKVEISRVNHSEVPLIETYTLRDFQKRLSKIFQIKLAVAIDIAKTEHLKG
ncbi:hypothetical protein GMA19_03454 [Paenibacillus polymyxa E681]|uniref:hypothetical protein n=1 Tax=Paenibacillus polymyxa TaxID=1406 RepID=UPI0001E319BE|nr:hypothetical protein [Paenibacillus polymyxa]ADM71260.1 hypothetical protein PPE_03443 [Paenibacillus polymyxa E681]QNV58283.1 hypothetical protein GE561_03456 [Paenibacillus polymyxa E681]QNV63118.1 hypothetical protein GMA19_03454 [Paenibacillus polymyxa E681]